MSSFRNGLKLLWMLGFDLRVPDGGRVFVPEGHHENSPAFQRRVRTDRRLSPEGTAEV